MLKKVVIVGHSYLSRLSLIRSVAQLGCDITVIVTATKQKGLFKKPIDCYSQYINHLYQFERKDIASLILLLKTKCTDPHEKVVIIPDGDDIVAALDNNREELSPFFIIPYISKEPSSIQFWMEKTNQKKLAREVGLDVTDGVVVDIVDGKYSLPEGIHYPCYCKPLATMNGGKGGMRRCNDTEDLAQALDYIIQYRSRNERVLVEDYKEIDTEYALLGFCDGREVVIPGIFQLLTVSKHNKGIALQGRVIPTEGFEVLVKKFQDFVLRIGFVGVFDIDFFRSGGVFYFCEMNLRFGGSGYALTKMGVNLPAMLVKFFWGESIHGMNNSIKDSATYVNEKMCIEDWMSGVISWREFNHFIHGADIRFIPDAQDSKPERAYNWIVFFRRIQGFVKALS